METVFGTMVNITMIGTGMAHGICGTWITMGTRMKNRMKIWTETMNTRWGLTLQLAAQMHMMELPPTGSGGITKYLIIMAIQ